ncbi:hypothetical protein MAH1_36200 [Sessilibacter sp. MAH1]
MKVLLFVLLIIFSTQSLSQIGLLGSSSSSNESQEKDNDNVSELIEKIESPEQRQQLIEDLKTLETAQQQEGKDNKELEVQEIINFEEKSTEFKEYVSNLLSEFNIPESTAWEALVLAALLLITIVALVILKFAYKTAKSHLKKMNLRLHLNSRRFIPLLHLVNYAIKAHVFIFVIYAVFVLYVPEDSFINRAINITAIVSFILAALALIFVAILIWESANAAMEFVSSHSSLKSNARMNTVMPIIRNALLFTLSLLFIMVFLSGIGVDIYPLLAGAGVLGIAVGFGAQTLVKDFLTGFTVIIEDLLQIGDVVTVANRTGVVETLSIRKLQLRALDGTVHTVPFGEVSIVDNLTKDFSFYLMDVGVAYKENTDVVIECLREIDEEIRNDDDFKDRILSPIEIFGVDKFADSAVIIKARIKTRPLEKWNVGREFNRRMKYLFDERNIEIPFPHRTLYFGEPIVAQTSIQRQEKDINSSQSIDKKTDKVYLPDNEDATESDEGGN